ncbi:MAG: hypothetical protein U5N26_01455 [Candidatus Marinimicrobia bacterium]|nr:hypothetical protein [Candidatus Neomarinimicrobiota bacterium]
MIMIPRISGFSPYDRGCGDQHYVQGKNRRFNTYDFRSKGSVSTNGIARRFGGGGHQHASGIVSKKPLEELFPEVIDAMVQHVKAAFNENPDR